MQWLAQTKGTAAVYLTDGIQRVWVINGDHLKSIQGLLRARGMTDTVYQYSPGNIDKGMAGQLVGPEAPEGSH